jgi:hypothetical protein
MANNADVIYVHKNNAVYRSSDGGLSWGTVTYNLPNVNHRRILAEQYGGTQELVMIATNNAVYYKKAGQTTWTNFSTGLPPRKSPSGFSMFDDGTTQARIRYASYGRGMWESGFDKIRAFSANINFLTDTTITCYSPNIQVSDGSLGTVNTPLTYTWNFPGGTPATAFNSSATVSYTATGNYTMSLTIRDALNNVSTKTLNKFIQVIGCATDTIPGNALQVNGTTNYARTNGALPIGTTNSITLSAWIKINSTQASFAGIIFTGSGGATGLDFRNANQLGYHYNNGAATYNFGGGPTVPLGEWVHVAMVTTAANTTLYMNGVPYVNNVANAAVNFSSGFTLGNDRDNSARTMDGQMDEICIYNRALSQNEIRELMHLTKNYGVIDAGLVGYYQFNEVGNTIYNRVGTMNAVMLGTGQHTLSTAPVGSGTSLRQTVNTSGLKLFPNQGSILAFPGPALPFGEICLTRIHLQPDSVPTNNFANDAMRYWVVNNYGNPTFVPLNTMSLTGYGNITSNEANAPRKFKLYSRNTGGYLQNGWTLIDSASAATSGTNGALTFTGSGVGSFNKQYTIVKSPCIAPVIGSAAASSTYICVGGTVNLSVAQGTLNDAVNWKWYSGACGGATVATGTVAIISPTTTTTYYLRGEGGCVVNASVCTAITISVNPSLQIPVTPLAINVPNTLCQASSQVFSVSSIPGAAAYSWTLPASWMGSSTTNSISVQIGASGTIGVTASNMCGTSGIKTVSVVTTQSISSSRSATICAGDKLVVGPQTYTSTGTYSFAIPRQSGCDSLVITNLFVEPTINTGVTVSILDLIANENNATYQWIDCATQQVIAGANSQTYTAQQNGSYAVIVTVNNCSDTSACMQMVEVGIKENGARAAVVIHPNPAQDLLYVNVPVSGLNFKLTNAVGQEILKGGLMTGNNTIRLTGVAVGVYYLSIEGLESTVVRKVMIE